MVFAGWPILLTSAALGACFGSFLNVVIYRLPRGLSLVSPPSTCPRCDQRIAPYDNVPVLGWLWLRGRCRQCREPISFRYPVVEFLTAGLFVLLAWHYGAGLELVPALYFALAMVAVTLIDYDHQIIPDVISLSGIPLGLLSTLVRPLPFLDSLLGAVLGFGLLLGVALGYKAITGRDGMGGGDVKLAAMLGAFLGWQGMILTVFLASLGGSVVGILLIALNKGGRRTAIPFGTFLAPAGVLVYMYGPRMVDWYAGYLRP